MAIPREPRPLFAMMHSFDFTYKESRRRFHFYDQEVSRMIFKPILLELSHFCFLEKIVFEMKRIHFNIYYIVIKLIIISLVKLLKVYIIFSSTSSL